MTKPVLMDKKLRRLDRQVIRVCLGITNNMLGVSSIVIRRARRELRTPVFQEVALVGSVLKRRFGSWR